MADTSLSENKIGLLVWQLSNYWQSKLRKILRADQIKCDPIHRYSFARDASFYRLIPEAIVQPEKNKDIQALFKFANQNVIPLTFRAAGTSLSGQSTTNHILVDISHGWKSIQISSNKYSREC